MTYRNLVVGTDGSTTAASAVDQAIDLAVANQARLVVVTAYRPHERAETDQAPAELQWAVTDRARADDLAAGARHAAAGKGLTDVVVRALDADPAEAILDAAEEFSADAIVVGSVGLTSPARFVLGSVAGSIAHHAPCDVLVVHTA